jgi:hypothetical protein
MMTLKGAGQDVSKGGKPSAAQVGIYVSMQNAKRGGYIRMRPTQYNPY